jgi:hypothetical protein
MTGAVFDESNLPVNVDMTGAVFDESNLPCSCEIRGAIVSNYLVVVN